MAEPFVNYYKILGVEQDATPEQIREAIRRQRKLWGARETSFDKAQQREAEDQMAFIRAAENTLLDPAKRADHDQKIANHVEPEPEPQESGSGGQGGRDWVALAAEYLRQNRLEAAVGAAREATERDGRNPDAWALRGRASLRLNMADNAIFEFGEAVRLRPESDEYHADLGGAYETKHDYATAIQCYETAQKLAPGVRRYPLSISLVYLEDGKHNQAIGILEPLHAQDAGDEFCNLLLASALHDYTLSSWTRVNGNGIRLITTREQVTLTKQNMTRALALTFDGDELRGSLNSLLGDALRAERRTFSLPGVRFSRDMGGGGGCLMVFAYVAVIGVLFVLLGLHPVFGVVAILAVGFGWYTLAVKPRWKRNAADARRLQASSSSGGQIRG